MQPSEVGLNITPYEVITQHLPRSFIANPAFTNVGEVSIGLATIYPAVGELRLIMAEILQDHLVQIDQIRTSGIRVSDKVESGQIGLAVSNLIGDLRDSGLFRNEEIGDIIRGLPLQRIDAASKYLTWEQLVELADELRDTEWFPGLVHGGLRPPHPGHTRLIRRVSAHSTHTLVGFDPSWERRRVKHGDEIPFRIPLAAAMHQVASTPFVDYVFVLPIIGLTQQERDEEMLCIYRRLGIRALGVGNDNPLVPKFEDRMNRLGGMVVQDELRRIASSTDVMYAHGKYSTIERFRPITEHFRLFIAHIDAIARGQGFLSDYPDQTELRNKSKLLKRLKATHTI